VLVDRVIQFILGSWVICLVNSVLGIFLLLPGFHLLLDALKFVFVVLVISLFYLIVDFVLDCRVVHGRCNRFANVAHLIVWKGHHLPPCDALARLYGVQIVLLFFLLRWRHVEA